MAKAKKKIKTVYTLQSKHPHHTIWLKIEGNPLPNLIYELRECGWTHQQIIPACSGLPAVHEVNKKGSDIFGSWSDEEYPKFLAEVKTILNKYDIDPGEIVRLTLQDLL